MGASLTRDAKITDKGMSWRALAASSNARGLTVLAFGQLSYWLHYFDYPGLDVHECKGVYA